MIAPDLTLEHTILQKGILQQVNILTSPQVVHLQQ